MKRLAVVSIASILMAAAGKSDWYGEGGGGRFFPQMPRDMIAAHSLVRARLGIAPLAWSNQLAAYAQNWAETLVRTGDFHPHRNPPYGENLYEITGAEANPYDVVNAWASESMNYNYRRNSCSARCGHFTQVVWRNTRAVGCGMARSGSRQVWVCSYDPPGNIIGEPPY